MFIGPQAATYDKLCTQQAGFISAGDGLHRVEIYGGSMSLTRLWDDLAGAVKQTSEEVSTTLGKILYFPALFRAYPNMQRLPVKLAQSCPSDPQASGAVDRNLVTSFYLSQIPNKNAAENVAYHESQHLVQAIEGFAAGSSPTQEFSRLARLWYACLMANERVLPINTYSGVVYTIGEQPIEGYQAFCMDLIANPDKCANASSTELVKERHLQDFLSYMQSQAYLNYYSAAGEVEARESAVRRHFSIRTTRLTLPAHAKRTDDAANDNGLFIPYAPRKRDILEDIKLDEYGLIRRSEIRPGHRQLTLGLSRKVTPAGAPVVLPL
jgi:hypothetical protein